MFFMPVDAATSSEEAELSFHANLPNLREDIPGANALKLFGPICAAVIS
jgi:hypothetical protein